MLGLIVEKGLLLNSLIVFKEAASHTLLHTLTLLVAGLVGREKFVLGTGSQHILLGIGHTIGTFLLDETTLHQGVVAVAQMLTQEVTIVLLGIETVDGFKRESLAIGALPLCIVVDNHQ